MKKAPYYPGEWRIEEMDLFDKEMLDLDGEEACIVVHRNLQGRLQFDGVHGWIDCRVELVGDVERLEFTWEGTNGSHPSSGRGWGVVKGSVMVGRIYIHNGDDSSFRAVVRTLRSEDA